MKADLELESVSIWVWVAVFASIAISLFDLLRKTVFLDAAWNYQYPEWALVYNYTALLLLTVTLATLAISFDLLLELDDRKFILTIVVVTGAVSALALLATPIKSYKWAFQPHIQGPVETFQYGPAKIAAEEGLKSFFSSFHSIPTLNGGNRLQTTKYLTEQLRGAEYLPWNNLLADYASNIVTQRHGPIPALLVAPFLFVFGATPTNAVIGGYTITIMLPVLTYFILRPYFDTKLSRLGTLLVMFSPAYLIYQRYGTVSYDAITAVVTALSVLLFLNACRTKRYSILSLAGIAFSGAMLSKISILTMLPTFFIIVAFYSANVVDVLRTTAIFGISCLVLPLSLILLGYNFLVQYLYDIARIQMSTSGPTGIFGRLVSIYNTRLLGVVILCFSFLFVASLLYQYPPNVKKRGLVAAGFLPSIMPFILFKGITLSRHLLPLTPLIVFIGLCGVDRLEDDSLTSTEAKLLLLSTIPLVLANL